MYTGSSVDIKCMLMIRNEETGLTIRLTTGRMKVAEAGLYAACCRVICIADDSASPISSVYSRSRHRSQLSGHDLAGAGAPY